MTIAAEFTKLGDAFRKLFRTTTKYTINDMISELGALTNDYKIIHIPEKDYYDVRDENGVLLFDDVSQLKFIEKSGSTVFINSSYYAGKTYDAKLEVSVKGTESKAIIDLPGNGLQGAMAYLPPTSLDNAEGVAIRPTNLSATYLKKITVYLVEGDVTNG